MSYNFNSKVRTSRMYKFADGSSLRVVRVAQKGEQTKWSYIRFEENAINGSITAEYVGNDWAWIDAEERAKRYASFCGDYKMKIEKSYN